MRWFEKIIEAHVAVTDAVSHFERMKSDRYFVWQEEASIDLLADNGHFAYAVRGTTDLFTTQEFDPWADEIETAFFRAGISFRKNSVQYEENTGIVHHEWEWTVWDE